VHDEGEVLGVQAIDQRVELPDLGIRIRRVAEDAEGKGVPGQRRERGAADEQRDEDEPKSRTPS
jgi:hypothetical protein